MWRVVLPCVVAACGYPSLASNDPDGGGGGDGQTGCQAKSSYGNTLYTQAAEYSNSHDDMTYNGALTSGSTTDLLQLDIQIPGPSFPHGPTTASITLTGNQLTWDQCDVCVSIAAHCVNCTLDTGTPGSSYMVTQGTLTITDAGQTTIGGTLTNAKFRHVNVADNGTATLAGDGCTTSIASIAFETSVTVVQ
jgi:hypothetical protein